MARFGALRHHGQDRADFQAKAPAHDAGAVEPALPSSCSSHQQNRADTRVDGGEGGSEAPARGGFGETSKGGHVGGTGPSQFERLYDGGFGRAAAGRRAGVRDAPGRESDESRGRLRLQTGLDAERAYDAAPKGPLAVSIFDAVSKLGLSLEKREISKDGIVVETAQRLEARSAATAPTLTPEQIASVDRYVTEEIQLEKTPGVAVGIYSRGQILLAKGYGLANVELNVPVKAEPSAYGVSRNATRSRCGLAASRDLRSEGDADR